MCKGLDATVQTLRTKLDRADRKVAVLEIEKKRLNTERDNMASQLGVAFQTCEELKNEKSALSAENAALRQENDHLRAENESLREQLEQDASQHREETVQLRRQFDQAANATERENATLHAELTRIRAEQDEQTQQISRKDIELRKARQEQAEYARLKADHEALKSQLANLKAKRDEEVKRWTRQESHLKAQVDRRDETIRQFQDLTQEQTNEAMRLDNHNLRQELAQLTAQHDEENEQWAMKEAELQRKIQRREDAARKTLDMTREVLAVREMNEQSATVNSKAKGRENPPVQQPLQRKSSYRREDSRTRIKTRAQEEERSNRATNTVQQSSRDEETIRKPYSGVSRFSNRSTSAPIQPANVARVESEVESTTDLSLAPRGTPYTSRTGPSTKSTTTVQPPADLDLTELSCIDSNLIAQLRRTLEEERAAARRQTFSSQTEHQTRDDTIGSRRQTREDTVRSVASAKSERRPSLVRKSSLKDTTQRTNVTHFEEDTANMSNLDADAEATQTRQSVVDASTLSNTSRRRRSTHNEMTSAFIVPDIKLDSVREVTTTIRHTQKILSKDHDNANCTVCRRQGLTTASSDLRIPKLIPVSSRMPEDVDATLRPARSPKEALAVVVKELQDERYHLHAELAVMRAMLESHDVSLGNRKRREINASIQEILRKIDIKDTQIYNLYDVLEGQQTDELTELDVENLTQQIRSEEEKEQPDRKAKKVTIRSFVDEEDDSEDDHHRQDVEMGRGVQDDGETQELPWEGFEEEADGSFGKWGVSTH